MCFLRQRLTLDNIGLAKYIASRFTKRYPQLRGRDGYEDAEQEAVLGLVKAADGWDGVRAFGAYATVVICHHLRDFVCKEGLVNARYRDTRPLVVLFHDADRDAKEPADTHFELRAAMLALPDSERELINRRFFGRETQAEVAADLGIGRVTVLDHERRALASLRNLMGDE